MRFSFLEIHRIIPEFPLVKEVWYHYHQQEANPDEDRIFGTFIDGTLAAVARCRLHPDGHEVDGVFTLEEYRGRGLARIVVQALICLLYTSDAADE